MLHLLGGEVHQHAVVGFDGIDEALREAAAPEGEHIDSTGGLQFHIALHAIGVNVWFAVLLAVYSVFIYSAGRWIASGSRSRWPAAVAISLAVLSNAAEGAEACREYFNLNIPESGSGKA